MKTLTVALAERSYPIYIGDGVLADPDYLLPHLAGKQVLVVSNSTVAPLYLDRVLQSLQGADIQCDSLVLPDGEQYKTLATFEQILEQLLQKRHHRHTTLCALGGGVIGDMVGFAAACYQRGVAFIQIPTTLLAQVDSSVGGKTAVNHALGKNMIGAFHQPQAVLADTQALTTLPPRELAAGLAEVIKYGLIEDATFFHWLQDNITALNAAEPEALAHSIYRSCQVKAEIVAQDERESGVRALLNLGHTFGHAIEAGMGYGQWLHGEAVAVGMLMAARTSQRLGWLANDQVAAISALLQAAKLPIHAPSTLSPEQFLHYMALDKKVIDGRLRLILLREIGRASIETDIETSLLTEVIQASYAPSP